MSLISRIEISNYLTGGLAESRRIADWRPMLNGITLRLDNKSALVNITNGGGKTSMADLILYVLSRDTQLLKRVREKCSPKERGYTHARIEFRETSHDSYSEPGLFSIDPLNQPGETHVIGVAMTDKAEDTPIFYCYSGTLEDSPCYIKTAEQIVPVPDTQFSSRTRAMPGSKWNKHTSRKEWEDQIALFISVDVVRRNVKYQVEGSDDQNADFFTVKPRSGESDDRAFFRSVVAPDLLTNLMSTWAEANEQSVEDTLHLSLSQIVKTDETLAKQEKKLEVRQGQLDELSPLLEIGERATRADVGVTAALHSFRKDAALVKYFGDSTSKAALPGLPRPIESLARDRDLDPRVLQALSGMLLSAEDPIMLVDKTLSDLAGVAVKYLTQISERKKIRQHTPKSQVIDFKCVFGKISSGSIDGTGHLRKAYSRNDAIALVPLLKDHAGATVGGLEAVLALAFDIAEAQIDTNPGAIEERRLNQELATANDAIAAAQLDIESLGAESKRLEDQLTSRADNLAAWNEFQAIAHQLPEDLRADPLQAKEWIVGQLDGLSNARDAGTRRHARLEIQWATYQELIAQAELAGIEGVKSRFGELDAKKKGLESEIKDLQARIKEARSNARTSQEALSRARIRLPELERKVEILGRDKAGYDKYSTIFGDVHPTEIDPERDRDVAQAKLSSRQGDLRMSKDECDRLAQLQARSAALHTVFGAIDPLTYDPVKESSEAAASEAESRERQARLIDKVEALDNFEGMFPCATPQKWIVEADAQYVALTDEKVARTRERNDALAELDAIAAMKVVDNGDFGAAWRLMGEHKIPARRLFEVVRDSDLSLEFKKPALSALSGLLSAPVLESREHLLQASTVLSVAGLFVPLIDAAALGVAINNGIESAGNLHLITFLGGQYSRRVRILLEPGFAELETARLSQVVADRTSDIADLQNRLVMVSPYEANYRLARVANEAVAEQAREKYDLFAAQIALAQKRLDIFAIHTTQTSLAILQAAREFLQRGGLEALSKAQAEHALISEDIALVLQPDFDKAAALTSRDTLNAIDAAVRFLSNGGLHGHIAAIDALSAAKEEVASLAVVANGDALSLAEVESAQERLEGEFAAFADAGHIEDLRKLSIALGLHANTDDLSFLRGYEMEVDRAALAEKAFQEALRVNFGRALTYKNNMSLSDQQVQDALTSTKAKYGELLAKVETLEKRKRVIEEAERPAWIATRRSIHELAYAVGKRMQSTRAFAADDNATLGAEEYPAEAHPLFKQFANIEMGARALDSSHGLVQAVNDLVLEIEALDFEKARGELEKARSIKAHAEQAFIDSKREYCERARGESSMSETALNALEIEEIERSSPDRLQSLATLFERLKHSIDKDREAALKSRDVATQAHEAALEHLANLMQLAETNIKTLDKVMARYPGGRFFVSAGIVAPDRMREILQDLKHEVAHLNREASNAKRSPTRDSDRRIKQMLRDALIDRIFVEPTVEFTNSGIWNGARRLMSSKMSTGEKVALQFMWIIRQAEFEIDRGLIDLSREQAKKSRSRQNRMILIDGIFSSLSDRHMIKEAMSGLKDLGGNFQIVGLLHSTTWVNDYSVFPVYHVGYKLGHSTGKSLVVFEEGREPGTLEVFSTFNRAIPKEVEA